MENQLPPEASTPKQPVVPTPPAQSQTPPAYLAPIKSQKGDSVLPIAILAIVILVIVGTGFAYKDKLNSVFSADKLQSVLDDAKKGLEEQKTKDDSSSNSYTPAQTELLPIDIAKATYIPVNKNVTTKSGIKVTVKGMYRNVPDPYANDIYKPTREIVFVDMQVDAPAGTKPDSFLDTPYRSNFSLTVDGKKVTGAYSFTAEELEAAKLPLIFDGKNLFKTPQVGVLIFEPVKNGVKFSLVYEAEDYRDIRGKLAQETAYTIPLN